MTMKVFSSLLMWINNDIPSHAFSSGDVETTKQSGRDVSVTKNYRGSAWNVCQLPTRTESGRPRPGRDAAASAGGCERCEWRAGSSPGKITQSEKLTTLEKSSTREQSILTMSQLNVHMCPDIDGRPVNYLFVCLSGDRSSLFKKMPMFASFIPQRRVRWVRWWPSWV